MQINVASENNEGGSLFEIKIIMMLQSYKYENNQHVNSQ